MRRNRRTRRRERRRTRDKGRWALRIAADGEIGGATWSLSSKPKPKRVRKAS